MYLCKFYRLSLVQALVAIREVTKQASRNDPNFSPIQPLDYGRLLVISLGTGRAKQELKYSAEMAAKWGLFGWLIQGNSSPLVDVFTQAPADMVDYFISVVFQALHNDDNYLRIQVRLNQFLFFYLYIYIYIDLFW